MPITAPPDQHRPNEALLRLAQSWLIALASLLATLVERCGGRHQRLLRPFVLLIERRLALWLCLSAFARLTLPPARRGAALPLSAPSGFHRACRSRVRVRHLARGFGRGSLAARLQRIADIMANPARRIARLAVRLARGHVGSRLIARAPPARLLAGAICVAAFASADTS